MNFFKEMNLGKSLILILFVIALGIPYVLRTNQYQV